MIEILDVRKRPVMVQAVRWQGSPEIAMSIVDWITSQGTQARYLSRPNSMIRDAILIDTLEGTMEAIPGDWIIRGVAGEFYPCKPDIFQETYEDVWP